MTLTEQEQILHAAYQYFNSRADDKLLDLMTPDVHWPNGWEGGWVNGRDEVKAYWTRQWKEIDPVVTPEGYEALPDGRVAVRVHQLVKDLSGKTIADVHVQHIYTFRDDLVAHMEIRS
ncbi:MAG: nuclear transport factor 2 family protein [Sphingobacteriales bacterium]|nr:MAG: nuclear transport factor 2 family protein [Sphingobacteriales bacterium]